MDEKIVKDSRGLVKDLVNDCISRRAAIDALDEIRHALWEIDIPSPTVPEYIEHHEQIQSVWKLLDKKQKELYAMPSAQPTQNTRVNSSKALDTISREAAIDEIKALYEWHDIVTEDRAIEHLKKLPSAQSERKRGKWEIYVISMFDGEGCRCSECGLEGVPYWDFCPNCGANMREDNNETD